jgi:hypothetical protein
VLAPDPKAFQAQQHVRTGEGVLELRLVNAPHQRLVRA